MRIVKLPSKKTVQSLVYCADGRTLVVSQPRVVTLLDPLGRTAHVRQVTHNLISGYEKAAYTVTSVTTDGHLLAVWGSSVCRIDPSRDLAEEITLAPRIAGTTVVAPGGRFAAAGAAGSDNCLRLWKIGAAPTAVHLGDTPGLPGTSLPSIAFLPDEQTLAATGWDQVDGQNVGHLAVYDISTRARTSLRRTPYFFATGLLATPDSSRVIVFSTHSFCVFDVRSLDPEPITVKHPGLMVSDAWAVHPSGHHLVTTGADGVLRVWDTASWREVNAYNWKVGKLTAIAFGPEGAVCSAAGSHGRVVVWDWEG